MLELSSPMASTLGVRAPGVLGDPAMCSHVEPFPLGISRWAQVCLCMHAPATQCV